MFCLSLCSLIYEKTADCCVKYQCLKTNTKRAKAVLESFEMQFQN